MPANNVTKEKNLCSWADVEKPYYLAYHDNEWGVPVHDDRVHFEFLILEGAQAGLSWDTILRKREGYKRAFADFDPEKVAGFTDSQLENLLKNPAIVRNRLKVFSARKNAIAFLQIQKEFGSYDNYVWQFIGGEQINNACKSLKVIPAKTEVSDRLSKDLKKRGMNFVGSTIIYAYMQATGLVNDHEISCWRYTACSQ